MRPNYGKSAFSMLINITRGMDFDNISNYPIFESFNMIAVCQQSNPRIIEIQSIFF